MHDLDYSSGDTSKQAFHGKQDTVIHLTTFEEVNEFQENPTEVGKADHRLELTKWQFYTIFSTLCLTLSINGLDANILGDAASEIVARFQTIHISWMGSIAFLTASIITLPLSLIYRQYEPRYLLIGSLCILATGEALAGSSKSFNMLLIGRFLVGIAIGSTAVGTFLVVGLICSSTSERALYLSLVTALYGVMLKVGPLVSGALLKLSKNDWRWCFYVELPIIGVVMTLIACFFPRLKPTNQTSNVQSTDLHVPSAWSWVYSPISTFLQALFVVALMVPCIFGGSTFEWSSSFMIACYILTPLFLLALIIWEMRIPDQSRLLPILTLRKNRQLGCISIVHFCAMITTFATTYFVPIYFQVVYKSSPIHAAVQILPLVVSGTVACVLVGKIAEKGHYVLSCVLGSALQVLGAGLFHSLLESSPLWKVYIYEVIIGAGCGSLTAIGTTVALHNVSREQFPRPVSYINAVLVLGAAVGIGIQGALLNNQFIQVAKSFFPDVTTSSIATKIAELGSAALIDKEGPIFDSIRKALVESQRQSSLLYMAAGCVSLVASTLLPRVCCIASYPPRKQHPYCGPTWAKKVIT